MRPQCLRGFTILEIMVVLVLISIITGMAMLSVGGSGKDRLADEALRLALWVETHQNEALLSSQMRAIRFERHGYNILRMSEEGWSGVENTEAFSDRILPEDIALELWVEGQPVSLKEPGPPQVALLNSGEVTEFAVIFAFAAESLAENPRHRVSCDGLGRLTLDTIGQ